MWHFCSSTVIFSNKKMPRDITKTNQRNDFQCGTSAHLLLYLVTKRCHVTLQKQANGTITQTLDLKCQGLMDTIRSEYLKLYVHQSKRVQSVIYPIG